MFNASPCIWVVYENGWQSISNQPPPIDRTTKVERQNVELRDHVAFLKARLAIYEPAEAAPASASQPAPVKAASALVLASQSLDTLGALGVLANKSLGGLDNKHGLEMSEQMSVVPAAPADPKAPVGPTATTQAMPTPTFAEYLATRVVRKPGRPRKSQPVTSRPLVDTPAAEIPWGGGAAEVVRAVPTNQAAPVEAWALGQGETADLVNVLRPPLCRESELLRERGFVQRISKEKYLVPGRPPKRLKQAPSVNAPLLPGMTQGRFLCTQIVVDAPTSEPLFDRARPDYRVAPARGAPGSVAFLCDPV